MTEILRFFALAGLGAALFVASNDKAQAATRYDGNWTVFITTTRGDCGSDQSFTIQVHDGIVSGPFNAHGRVSAAGNARVSVSSENLGTASGSGHLSENSGRGTWHGAGPRGSCYGRWSATR